MGGHINVKKYGINRGINLFRHLHDAFLDLESKSKQNCPKTPEAFCNHQRTSSGTVYYSIAAFTIRPFVPRVHHPGTEGFFHQSR